MQAKKNDYSRFYSRNKIETTELKENTPAIFQQHPDYGLLPYNTPCTDCYEVLEKRSATSRYFIKNNTKGHYFYLEQAAGAIHYTDEAGYLRPIDEHLYPTEKKGVFEASNQPISTKIDFTQGFTSITLIDNFEFSYNKNLTLYYQKNETISAKQNFNYSNFIVGKDGAWITNGFPLIDAEFVMNKGSIKTNFILKNKEAIDTTADYLIIEDFIALDDHHFLIEDLSNGHYLKNKTWKGEIIVKNTLGLSLLTMQMPLIIDQTKNKNHEQDQVDAIGYELIAVQNGFILRLKVDVKWLTAPQRNYPIIIDPLLIGEGVYTASDIGFEFNSTCFTESDYCDYAMDVIVPGKTTLTAAYFDGTYYSQNFGCFFTADCLMKEAGFRILGPCDDSPSSSGFWTCLPPVGDTAGTCYGVDLDLFNTIACIAPQCDDYIFNFEMRTFMCSCTKPPCDITCHYMPTDSWIITIEGLTVEENTIISTDQPDFTICLGESLQLQSTGNFGVPPYTYLWTPGSLITPILTVSPTETTSYTAIIIDACDMRDTVTQLITVLPLPTLAPGPFEACNEVVADAGGGYIAYLWNTGETTQLISIDSAGIYFVTVTDINGCTNTSEPISVIINTAPLINAFPDTVFVENGELAQLNVETSSAGIVNFLWAPEEDVTCLSCVDPLGVIYGAGGSFFVTGEQNGCVSLPDTIIVINAQTQLLIPNAFSPNSDGVNDIFKGYSPIYFPEFSMAIYNRWGALVFTSNDMLNGWDGTYLNAPQEIGSYVWIVNYTKLNATKTPVQITGTVALLR